MHRAIAYRDPSQENNENFEPPANIGSMFCWVYFFKKKKGNNNKRSRDLLHNCPGTRKKRRKGIVPIRGQLGKSR